MGFWRVIYLTDSKLKRLEHVYIMGRNVLSKDIFQSLCKGINFSKGTKTTLVIGGKGSKQR